MQFYRQIMATESIHRIILTTLRITALTSIIAVVLAYIVAYALAHMGPRQRMLLLLCVLIPFWLSVLVRALSWLILLRNNGLVNSALLETGLIGSPLPLVRNETGVIIGMVHYLVPYAVFPIYAAMQSLDSRVFMAARSVGGRPWRVFFDVYLPLTVPSVLGAGLLVFVFGLGFFITPAILGGGRVVMLSEYVSISVLQTVRWGLAAALSVLLLVTTLALIALVRRFAGAGKLLGAAR
ncbi:putative spermidine/putrescine transport system permease protein [Rhizobium subbaraonis]|uniref:Putative spermidine/putrescine transport system permease protein n=1 Tax=Rhizobium subbaraonis TaxID=908946 RepID=A0A285UQS9_9HYPH|nr:putative spermidine/putrescine transport system permease protein [Rhizobium subbaraonis]